MKNLDEVFPTDLPHFPGEVAEQGRRIALFRRVQEGGIGAYVVYDGPKCLGMVHGHEASLMGLLQDPNATVGDSILVDDITFMRPDHDMLNQRIYDAELLLDLGLHKSIGPAPPESPPHDW